MDLDDKILIVDDDPAIRRLIHAFLEKTGYSCLEAEDGKGLFRLMADHHFPLILLDIKLPDQDGLTLLPQILEKDPDVCVVMLTGVIDVKTATLAIRKGAFDYIPKPFTIDDLQLVVSRGLEKRRLEIENRNYQRTIEEKNLRLEILHDLSIKIAFSLLSTIELEEILRTILVGITVGEGLGLNRAFLALFNDNQTLLQGKIAIGPGNWDEAERIWASLTEREHNLAQALEEFGRVCRLENTKVNQIVQKISFSYTDEGNILIQSAKAKQSFNVKKGRIDGQPINQDIINLLGTEDFAVVPLCSPHGVQGVIIADNYFNRKLITAEDITAMGLFANQASLAVEKSKLYSQLAQKVASLEAANKKLEENRDRLIQAERLSALGEMSAQIAHEMRNPLASIGGLARFIQKHIQEEKYKDHLETIVREILRLEQILSRIFNFIQDPVLSLKKTDLHLLLSSCLTHLQPQFTKLNISFTTDFFLNNPELDIDEDQIKEALLDIFHNAIEAMPSGGRLTVATRETAEGVKIEIKDTGPGMIPEQSEKVGRPFFSTKTYGIGLGLALAEKNIKAHKGKINLSSVLGAGTCVTISLPSSAPR